MKSILSSPAIIVLSARDADSLKRYAGKLLQAINMGKYRDEDLPDIAYTLQTGREPMEERLAMEVDSLAGLAGKLQHFIEDRRAEGWYRGNKKNFRQAAPAKTQRVPELWAGGGMVDWQELYSGRADEDLPRRISLPTYPFDRKRYWIKEADSQAREEEPYQLLLFGETWQEEAEMEEEDPAPPGQHPIRRIVCCASKPGSQDAIRKTLKTFDGQTEVSFIAKGHQGPAAAGVYQAPGSGGAMAWQSLFQDIRTAQGDIDAVIYLWPLEDTSHVRDYETLFVLLQGFSAVNGGAGKLVLAGQWLKGDDEAAEGCYLQSWVGLRRSLKLILPDLQLSVLLGETSRNGVDMDQWIRRVWRQLHADGAGSVLFRDECRHRCQIASLPAPAGPSVLQQGGVYLITGGMGSLGLLLAERLALRYAARLVLTGRSPLDTDKLATIGKLERTGARVLYIQADCADREAMRAVLEEARSVFGTVNGVVHAAGVVDSKMLPEKTTGDWQKVLAPKVAGTVILDELTKDDPLDFLCYFASSSAMIGDFGAGDYAMANRFQWAFAAYRNQMVIKGMRTGRTMALHWPLWKEGGMDLGEEENTRLYLRSSGQRYLESREGLDLFEKMIGTEASHILIMAGQETKIDRFLQAVIQADRGEKKMKGSNTPKRAPSSSHAPKPAEADGAVIDKNISRVADEAGRLLENELRELIGRELEVPPGNLLPEENLADMGFDSIGLTSLARSLSRHFDVSIAPAIFFGYSTIDALKAYFFKEHRLLIESRYRPAPLASPAVAGVQVPAGVTPGYGAPSNEPGTDAPPVREAAGRCPQQPAPFPEPIAIIGMSGRFPDARNTTELWTMLAEGRDAVKEIPPDRFDWRRYYSPDVAEAGKSVCKWSGLIPGIREFDPAFFEISPAEAETMDPRQRLLLQEAWRALEDAAYGPLQLTGSRIGVFVGAEEGGYAELTRQPGLTSTHNAILAARLSYFLNLNGPNLAVNTACSSGLVAAHQAIQSLLLGECDTALAAGVNLMFVPELYVGMSQAGMLSADGKCYAFDKRANGMVPAEAIAVVVMKPLSRALNDGDPIYATILSSGVNYDGKTNGITAPNALAQAALYRSVYQRAGVDPREIEYIVTHGTGTRLGDPVEVNAIHAAFKEFPAGGRPCALTSAKSNLGHTFAASGLVNLVCLIQALRHEMIPPTLHCREESDYVDWSTSRLFVNKELRPWPVADGRMRLGAVSAFGMSGTNAHLLVAGYDAAPPAPPVATGDQWHVLVLSAKTEPALQTRMEELAVAFESDEYAAVRMVDVAYTLLSGRHHFRHRAAVVVQTREHGARMLRQAGKKNAEAGVLMGEVPRDFKPRSAIRKFIAGLAGKTAADAISSEEQREDAITLAELYCQGYDLVFPVGSEAPRRIHLPGYPFARDEYWLEPPAVAGPSPAAGSSASQSLDGESTEPFELMLLEESWIEDTSPQPDSNAANPGIASIICLLADPGHEKEVMTTLRRKNPAIRVHFVYPPEFIRSRERDGAVDVFEGTTEQGYTAGLERIVREEGPVDAVLYLWPLEDPRYRQEFFPVYALLRAICVPGSGIGKVVLGGCWAAEAVHAAVDRCYQESWIGLERTIGGSMPDLQLKCVFHEMAPGTGLGEMIEACWRELQTAGSSSALYRNGRRWVPHMRKAFAAAASPVIRPGGTYLLTGGLGGLGILFARHLASRYKANLVLVGRTPVDIAKQDAISGLETLGGQVLYLQADIGDEALLRTALQPVKERFGVIHGILHCAGVAGTKAIFNQEYREFVRVLTPKVQGTAALDRVLAAEPMDFVCYFSSGTAILGDFGTCNYSMANRFQMAYARYREQLRSAGMRNGRTYVINWPLWREGGMNLRNENAKMAYLRSTGQRLLEKEEGIALFEQVISQASAQWLVLAVRPSAVAAWLGNKKDAGPPAVTAPASATGADGQQGQTALATCIENDLKEQVFRLLKIPTTRIDIHENLVDMGFDSILLTRWARQLTQHFGMDIQPAVFFGYPTLTRLTGWFLEQQGAFIEAFYRTRKETALPVKDLPMPRAEPQAPPMSRARYQAPPVAVDLNEPVAIIGMSGRFPGARDIAALWKILAGGIDAVGEIPPERWDWRDYYSDQQLPGRTRCKWGGFVDGVGEFDPLFFEISPREAAFIDPRQRLLLQEAWHALEDAGYGPAQLRKHRMGMYVGAEESGYGAIAGANGSITTNSTAILAARLAYFLNFSGPNMAVNTACSSGLVAVHQACLSLRCGECDTALAAGVNLLLSPEPFVAMSQAGMLSPDGKCHSFDDGANGMVPGEAVAVIVLKTFSKAIADGDPIYAVITGSGLNYDGKTNGITAPNGVAQSSLLRNVYDRYHLDPGEIDYVVAHGTGTVLGDAIELASLNEVFRAPDGQGATHALTSSKTNFGHTLAASGLVSLIGLVQAIVHRCIPPSLHCHAENRQVDWKYSPFYINKTAREWKQQPARELTGAVSAFGMSGTNAHLVVQGCDMINAGGLPEDDALHVLVLSAKTAEALGQLAVAMAGFLEEKVSLAATAYTLLAGRHTFRYRCAVVAGSREEAISAFTAFASQVDIPGVFRGDVDRGFHPQDQTRRYLAELAGQWAASHKDPEMLQELLPGMARLFCQGYDLPVEIMYGDRPPARIHLPGYPFAKERYWAGNPAPPQPAAAIPANIADPAPLAAAPPADPADDIKEDLIAMISEMIGLDAAKIEEDADFGSYGIDSIVIMQWKNKLEDRYGELPAGIFFDHPTIRQLSEFLYQHLADIKTILL